MAAYFECDLHIIFSIVPEEMVRRIRKQDQDRNRIIRDLEKRKKRTLVKKGPTEEDISNFRKIKTVRNYIRSK